MMKPEMVQELLYGHLEDKGVLDKNIATNAWKIDYSNLGGRGMFAIRDIDQGELIYVDAPLIVGPRCYDKYLPMCINCYKSDCPLFPCDRGCGLPVCSNVCESDPSHVENECKHLVNWAPKCGSKWSMELLQAVVPIRGLSLNSNQRSIIRAVEAHPRRTRELELLKKNIANDINEEDEKLMIRICQALDTGAFETAAIIDDEISISLRGLYPLGALQNHCCSPNTRHYFDRQQFLYTCAARPIKKGEELTMTYTDLVWDTGLRRQYLKLSKYFDCCCKRCSDPTEYGTLLGALRCASLDCFGNMFPNDPLNRDSVWTCEDCNKKVSSRQVKSIRAGLASIVTEMLHKSPREMLKFVEGELKILVPVTSAIIVDMKFRIISYFGRAEGLAWKTLSNSELAIKAKYCQELVQLLDDLIGGDSQKKGLILYEWYCTNMELKSRMEKENGNNQLELQLQAKEGYYTSNSSILKKAVDILRDDIAAPCDFSLMKIED